jgi:hypothetical protein
LDYIGRIETRLHLQKLPVRPGKERSIHIVRRRIANQDSSHQTISVSGLHQVILIVYFQKESMSFIMDMRICHESRARANWGYP